MGSALLALLLAAPFPPEPGEPLDEAWVNGNGTYFWFSDWADDAGLAPRDLRLEFRRDDAGYGAFDDTEPWSRGRYANMVFAVDGERWCWRAVAVNVASESSAPSVERCFRVDNTPPLSPGFVDAGAVVSEGRVVIEHSAAVDTVSGIAGYTLWVSNAPNGSFFDFSRAEPGVPYVTYLGEGQWYGWLQASDFANNTNRNDFGGYTIPITITANDAGVVPQPPRLEETITRNYGTNLSWDAGDFGALGVTHVVASFVELDAGASWHHGFTAIPATGSSAWLQLGDEGSVVARIAVVVGGRVGPWSPPSTPIIVDRTPPPTPTGVTVTPAASNVANFTLSWTPVPDERSGLEGFEVEQLHVPRGQRNYFHVPLPQTSLVVLPAAFEDGRFEFRVKAHDFAGNYASFSAPVTAVLDRAGPNATAPTAVPLPTDGGALVSLTWATPTDDLSAVASQELRENAVDGGATQVGTIVNAALRTVGPGRWTWQVRGTDSLGNVGAWSLESNVVVVSETGVAVGPAITTSGTQQLECGVPFTLALQGTGDAPLSWFLLGGPPGLTVSSSGLLEWTPPPATSGNFDADVKLQNGVGFVNGVVSLDVRCASATDGGVDGGEVGDAGSPADPARRALAVGCSCGWGDRKALMLIAVFLAIGLARRRRR